MLDLIKILVLEPVKIKFYNHLPPFFFNIIREKVIGENRMRTTMHKHDYFSPLQ